MEDFVCILSVYACVCAYVCVADCLIHNDQMRASCPINIKACAEEGTNRDIGQRRWGRQLSSLVDGGVGCQFQPSASHRIQKSNRTALALKLRLK